MWTNEKFCRKIHYLQPTKDTGSYFTTSKTEGTTKMCFMQGTGVSNSPSPVVQQKK